MREGPDDLMLGYEEEDYMTPSGEYTEDTIVYDDTTVYNPTDDENDRGDQK